MDHLQPREWRLRLEPEGESRSRSLADVPIVGSTLEALAASAATPAPILSPEAGWLEPDAERVRRLATETGLSPLTIRVCLMRGLTSTDQIREFLAPRFE